MIVYKIEKKSIVIPGSIHVHTIVLLKSWNFQIVFILVFNIMVWSKNNLI